MRDIVLATIADQPDVEVVGEIEEPANLMELVEQVRPDVLVVALQDREQRLSECGFLLGRNPGIKILALAPEKNRGILYWASVEIRTKAVESSKAGVLSALRDVPALAGTPRA